MRSRLRTPLLEALESRVMLSVYWVDDVASNGDGSSASPFSTITAAASVAIAGDTVNIRTGVYRETVNPLNSGTTVSPITYQAIDGVGTVTIKGTQILGTTANDDWALTAGQSYFETTTMNWTQGIGKDQIFVNDQMMLWARWPDNTTLDVSAPTSGATWENIDSIVSITDNADNSRRVTFTDAALGGNAADWVGGYIQLLPGSEWISQSGVVVAGSTNNTLVVDILSVSSIADVYIPVAGNPYYLTGKLSALDTGGEWFRDTATGKLYLNTLTGVDPDMVTVEAKVRDVALNLDGKSNLIFDGINIFGANITTNSASQDLILRNMDIKYASHYDLTTVGPWTGATTWSTNGWTFGTTDTGVVLDGTGNLIENSTIQYSAGNGITLKGNDIRIINNTILDTDYMATDAGAIFTAYGSSIFNAEIAYNTIDRSGRSGIVNRGTKASSIHHNDIARAMLQTQDGGGLYTYQNDGQGTVIAYNNVHDIYASGSPSNTFTGAGIYLDNGALNYSVHHNVVWNTHSALKLNTSAAAQNHQVFQNTLIGDTYAVQAWGKTGEQNMAGTVLSNNFLVGAVSVFDSSIFNVGNLRYDNASSVPVNVVTDMANGDLTLPFGSLAGEYGQYTAARPFSFGYTGTAPSAGALDVGQAMFAVGRQSGALPPNNGLLGLTVNPGVTLLGAGQYDTLGQGVSYSDSDTTNLINQNYGGTWRLGEGVDAKNGQIGYIAAGEWVEYTLNIQMAGTYTLDFQTDALAGSFVVKLGDGETFTSLGTVNVTNSGTTKVWTTPALNVTLAKGTQVLRLEFANGGYNLYDIRLTSDQQPYGTLTTIASSGTTSILPGYYDTGGEGIAYHDTDAVNQRSQPPYNSTFRTTEGVDALPDVIGWIANSEFVEYTVNVAQSGTYDLSFLGYNVWTATGLPLMNVSIGDGVNFTQVGNVTAINSTSDQIYTVSGVALSAGIEVLRLDFLNSFNLKDISFTNRQTPYATVPTITATGSTTIEAGSYDNGGQGVAYSDFDAVNWLNEPPYNGTFRTTEGVDARAGQIGFTNVGEWVEYTINVAATGTYNLEFQTNGNVQGAIDVELGDGGFFSTLGGVAVSVSSSKVWTNPLAVTLQAGEQVLRLKFTQQAGFNLYQIKITNVQQPYQGTAPTIASTGTTAILPGYYDTGGEWVAYYDTDAINWRSQPPYNSTFRINEGVDALPNVIAWINKSEFVEYTINVAQAGTYDLSFLGYNVWTATGLPLINVLMGDGINFTQVGSVTAINSTNYQTYTVSGVFLSAGIQVLKLDFLNTFNLNDISFTYISALQAASGGTNLSTSTLSPEQLIPLVTEATRRWEYAGFDVSTLDNVKWVVADLPNNLLGVTDQKTVYIDINGANWGWFIDSTPRDDREFDRPGNQGEQNRMDLLTVVTHELGHVLGLKHDNDGYLQSSLEAGRRNTPARSYIDLNPLAMAFPNETNHTQDKLHAGHLVGINWERPDLRLTLA